MLYHFLYIEETKYKARIMQYKGLKGLISDAQRCKGRKKVLTLKGGINDTYERAKKHFNIQEETITKSILYKGAI